MDYTQPDAHLGRGLAFPMGISVQGGLRLSSTHQNIAESIRVILGTRLGERLYRPNFGSRLSELVFSPLNTETLLLIRIHVREALEQWEPRIVLDEVLTEPDPANGRVDIVIRYHPKESFEHGSMVYPFYLMSPE